MNILLHVCTFWRDLKLDTAKNFKLVNYEVNFFKAILNCGLFAGIYAG